MVMKKRKRMRMIAMLNQYFPADPKLITPFHCFQYLPNNKVLNDEGEETNK
jgi:hypothetical protein